VAHDASEKAKDLGNTAYETASNAVGYVSETVVHAKDVIVEKAGQAGTYISDKAHDAAVKAGEIKDVIYEKACVAGTYISDKAHDAKEVVVTAASNATGKAAELYHTAADKACDAGHYVADKAHDLKEAVVDKAHDIKEALTPETTPASTPKTY